jgi:hypothetical protein
VVGKELTKWHVSKVAIWQNGVATFVQLQTIHMKLIRQEDMSYLCEMRRAVSRIMVAPWQHSYRTQLIIQRLRVRILPPALGEMKQ